MLKQLRLITEKTKWPVRGGEQVDALRSPQSIPLNPFVPDNADLAPPKVKRCHACEKDKTICFI